MCDMYARTQRKKNTDRKHTNTLASNGTASLGVPRTLPPSTLADKHTSETKRLGFVMCKQDVRNPTRNTAFGCADHEQHAGRIYLQTHSNSSGSGQRQLIVLRRATALLQNSGAFYFHLSRTSFKLHALHSLYKTNTYA